MPFTFTDEFYVMDPYAPPPSGTSLVVETYDVTDQNDNGVINRSSNDSIDGVDIRAAYPGDTVTVQYANGDIVTITGTTFYLADGREVFTPTDGSSLQDATFLSSTFVTSQGNTTPEEMEPVCFVAGTRILTPEGPVPVETLTQGQTVLGPNGTPLTLRLVLCRPISRRALDADHRLRPVRIQAGALGQALPERDLLVSRQHRMLISAPVVERMFGVPEVLVPAIKLVGLPGIFVDFVVPEVSYYHLVFDRHEVVIAEGAPSESLFAGPRALQSVTAAARDEILRLFPEIERLGDMPQPARLIPEGRLQKQLIARLAKNGKTPLARAALFAA